MSKQKRINKRKRRRRVLKVVLAVLIVILVLCAGAFGAMVYLFGNMNTVDFTENDSDLGVEETDGNSGITNIALFGVDTRDFSSDSGLSDAIIVLTVDEKQGVIKMTSILRDSKVPIEGYGEKKINHAYAYGGPTLAIKTLNQNFHLDIKEYVTVNFSQLADIVDAVGGITLELTPAEVSAANSLMQESFAGEPRIQGSGIVTLTGSQAVAYSRIRYLDSDNMRASRQQNVLNGVFEKIKTMPKSDYPSFIRQFLSIVETSLDTSDLLSLSGIAVKGFTIENYTIPDAEYETDLWGGIDSSGAWVWEYDIENAADRLHRIIYGEE
ncbi:MAG: LCP family protein [Clostridia bacterium]